MGRGAVTGASEGRSASERGAPSPGHPDRTGGDGVLPRPLEVGSAIAWDGEGSGGKASSSGQAGAEVAQDTSGGHQARSPGQTFGPRCQWGAWCVESPPGRTRASAKGRGQGAISRDTAGQRGHGKVSGDTERSVRTLGGQQGQREVMRTGGQWGPGMVSGGQAQSGKSIGQGQEVSWGWS